MKTLEKPGKVNAMVFSWGQKDLMYRIYLALQKWDTMYKYLREKNSGHQKDLYLPMKAVTKLLVGSEASKIF